MRGADRAALEATEAASRAERVNQVYANEPAGLLGTAVGSVVLAYVQGPVCGHGPAWTWCAVLLGVAAARLLIRLRFRRFPVSTLEADRWAHIFRTGVFVSGSAWGAAALLFFPEASPSHQIFTAFMIAGIVAGAAAAYPPLEWAFPAFAVPALAPILARAAFSDGPQHAEMTVMIGMFCVVMATVARSVRASARSAIALRFENRGLLESLSRTMSETLALNATLKGALRERERTEAELQRHRDQLEGMVARRTDELSRANRGLREALEEKERMEAERRKLADQLQLARKMESLATLAGGVAHDFNNLLMGIGGQVSLLLAGRPAEDPEAERLRAMDRQVREGAELTRQLLGLAMGGKYEVRPIDPNGLVRKVSALFARTHKEVRVSVRLEDGLGAVDADRSQIEQALLNICLNAWQAMPGGGTVDIGTRRATVDAAKAESYGAAPGEFAVITVADAGSGIDRSVLARIFDPFFTTREPGAGLRGRAGSGLGLSSAYGILRNHGGFIEVDSERGKGSTFSLWLPLSASEAPAAEADEGEGDGAAAGEAGRKTVLVVEDEPMVAEVAALMLQRLGLNVIKALNGEAALGHFRERGGRVDLVLLDMIMPGMGGDETFRRLREIDPEAKVLLSSGYSREGRAQELIKAGCLGFLQKPYNLAELRAKLEEILGPLVSAQGGGDA